MRPGPPPDVEGICNYKTVSPVLTDNRLFFFGIVERTPGPDCCDMIGERVVLGMAKGRMLKLTIKCNITLHEKFRQREDFMVAYFFIFF